MLQRGLGRALGPVAAGQGCAALSLPCKTTAKMLRCSWGLARSDVVRGTLAKHALLHEV